MEKFAKKKKRKKKLNTKGLHLIFLFLPSFSTFLYVNRNEVITLLTDAQGQREDYKEKNFLNVSLFALFLTDAIKLVL